MAFNSTGPRRRAVTAFFDERSQAQAAVDDLLAAGVERSRIALLEGGPGLKPDPVEPSSAKGFLAAVRELFMADEDHHAYGEGLQRGGFLLSVETGGGDHARVVGILDREGAVNMDARQSDWELEGWDPARAAADLHALSEAEVRSSVEPAGAVGPAFAVGGRPAGGGTAPAPDPAVAAMPSSAVQAAVEPAGAVGPAFAAGEQPTGGEAPAGRAVREAGVESRRLRSYVEAHDRSDEAR